MTSASVGRPLRIGLIAPPWVPVPPPAYGGTELVVDHLARGLQREGHVVRLFATGDSTCPVPRSSLFPRALGTTAEPSAELAHVEQAYHELVDVDLIHDHTYYGPLWASTEFLPIPVVTTNHGPFDSSTIEHFSRIARHIPVVAISHAQRATAPELPIAAVIHHGIDVAGFPRGSGTGGYLVFLGRMSPDKGVHRAIAIARTAGKKLIIAAKMWEPDERRYFSDVVQPMLGHDAVYVGQVTGRAKLELLAGAEALVNPIRWPEPFGLVMIESLATGTPVLAFAEGAAPEIVEHGRTGFLCADEADMVSRIRQIGAIDRDACRNSVAQRFSTERFVHDHLAFYRHVLESRSAVEHPSNRHPSAGGQTARRLAAKSRTAVPS